MIKLTEVRITLYLTKITELSFKMLLKEIDGKIVHKGLFDDSIDISYDLNSLENALKKFKLSNATIEDDFEKSQKILLQNLYKTLNPIAGRSNTEYIE